MRVPSLITANFVGGNGSLRVESCSVGPSFNAIHIKNSPSLLGQGLVSRARCTTHQSEYIRTLALKMQTSWNLTIVSICYFKYHQTASNTLYIVPIPTLSSFAILQIPTPCSFIYLIECFKPSLRLVGLTICLPCSFARVCQFY